MIELTVISFNGAAAQVPSVRIGEAGGSIGRADSNELVLPDSERTISRVHARVVHRDGRFGIVDSGSNPISINGLVLGAGREHPLLPGDTLKIGGYVIQVGAAQTPVDDGDLRAGPEEPRSSAAASAADGVAGADDWDPFAIDSEDAALPVDAAEITAKVVQPEVELTGPSGLARPPALAHATPGPSRHDPDPTVQFRRDAGLGNDDATASVRRDAVQVLVASPKAVQAPPQPSSLPAGAVLSWEEPPPDGRVVTLPVVRRGSRDAPSVHPSAEETSPATASRYEAALLTALLKGLDAPSLKVAELTPELMQRIGALLRETVKGAVELLAARAAVKREMLAEVTMLSPQGNNPLKFAATTDAALTHLLGTKQPGFMSPVPACKDAFDDLRAHQLAVMAGMRGALEGVLQRFDPAQLEAKLVPTSAVSTLIPGMRKAKLWEAFQELFEQLQSDAKDDFEALFGRAFLRAYEAQLDRVHRESVSD